MLSEKQLQRRLAALSEQDVEITVIADRIAELAAELRQVSVARQAIYRRMAFSLVAEEPPQAA